jgi:hypothetical protein
MISSRSLVSSHPAPPTDHHDVGFELAELRRQFEAMRAKNVDLKEQMDALMYVFICPSYKYY